MSLPSTLSSSLFCPLIEHDSADKVVSRGILYLLLISQYVCLNVANLRLTLVIRWSYGYRYLLAPTLSMDSSKPFSPPTETTPLSKADRRESLRHFDLNSDYHSTEHSTRSILTTEPGFDIIDRRSLRSASRESLTSFPALSIRSSDIPSQRLTYSVSSAIRKVIGVMNPPLWAVLTSVTVAFISPLQQEIFFNSSSFIHNSFFAAVDTAGAVAIPLILVSLGSSLAKSRVDEIDSEDYLPADLKMERRGIFFALFARMALVPLILAPLLVTTMYFGIKYSPRQSY
jgi:auxin efflux carrier family protein